MSRSETRRARTLLINILSLVPLLSLLFAFRVTPRFGATAAAAASLILFSIKQTLFFSFLFFCCGKIFKGIILGGTARLVSGTNTREPSADVAPRGLADVTQTYVLSAVASVCGASRGATARTARPTTHNLRVQMKPTALCRH